MLRRVAGYSGCYCWTRRAFSQQGEKLVRDENYYKGVYVNYKTKFLCESRDILTRKRWINVLWPSTRPFSQYPHVAMRRCLGQGRSPIFISATLSVN